MKISKVAFLVNEFPTLTETFIMNQIVFLLHQGIDVHIYSLYPGNFKNLHAQYKGYSLEEKVTYIATIPSSPAKRLKESFQFFKESGFWKNIGWGLKSMNPIAFGLPALKLTYLLFYSRLKSIERYDLVHVHFGNMGAFYADFVAFGFFKHLPYLVSFHGYDLVPNQTEINRERYRKMLVSARLFTVNSTYTSFLLDQVDSSIRGRVRLLPESLDTSLFECTEKSVAAQENIKFRLLFVGRLVGWKGADRAIDIIEKLVIEFGLKNVELTIIGKGPLQSQLERTVRERNLNEHVKLLGGQDQLSIKSFLSKSDLFLYTGRKEPETERAENQGLVLMEAQAMGVPVVAFEVGGISEGLIQGETGILVESEDIDTFCKSVYSLLFDEPRRLAMGNAARKFVKKRFDQKVLGNQLLEIYQKILQ